MPINSKAEPLYAKAIRFKSNMIDICIPRIEEIVELFNLNECKKELEELKEFFSNPELKIAIIGDFNTGKSTFINALLKDQTLSTAGIPTTVIPTYIRWNGKGKDPVIKVKFFDDDKEYSFDKDYSVLQKKLRFSFHNTKEGIEEITTNNSLIHIVEYVSISYPYDERFDHLCLIDTPGVNPGADETKEHATITREVLQKHADTTIILFPADAMGKRSAFEYLSENAAHLVNEASFVITKTDIVEGDKYASKLPDLLKGYIEQHLKVEPEKIYSCSARYALAHFTGKLESYEYAESFEKMTNEMFADIQEKKVLIIQQKLTALIQKILEKVQKETEHQIDDYSRKLKILERYSLQSYHLEYAEIQKQFEADIECFCKNANKSIGSKLAIIQKSVLEVIQVHLDACNGLGSLKNYANKGIKSDLKLYEELIIQKIKQDCNHIDIKYNAFSKDIVSCLNRYQLNVSSIARKKADVEREFAAVNTQVNVSLNIDSLIAGAIFTSILLYFINPLVLVAVIGVGVTGKSLLLKAAKRRLLSKIKEGILQSNSRIIEEWEKTNERLKNQCLVMSDKLASEYEEYYSSLFKQKQNDYLEEKDELNACIFVSKCAEYYLENINMSLSLSDNIDLFDDCSQELFQRFLDWDEDAMFKLADYYDEMNTPELEEKHDYVFSCLVVRDRGFVEYCNLLEQLDIKT